MSFAAGASAIVSLAELCTRTTNQPSLSSVSLSLSLSPSRSSSFLLAPSFPPSFPASFSLPPSFLSLPFSALLFCAPISFGNGTRPFSRPHSICTRTRQVTARPAAICPPGAASRKPRPCSPAHRPALPFALRPSTRTPSPHLIRPLPCSPCAAALLRSLYFAPSNLACLRHATALSLPLGARARVHAQAPASPRAGKRLTRVPRLLPLCAGARAP